MSLQINDQLQASVSFLRYSNLYALFNYDPLLMVPHIFGSHQSAYQSEHSTETALLKITNDRSSMNRGFMSSLLCLDISAAFDALDHGILLNKARDVFGIS